MDQILNWLLLDFPFGKWEINQFILQPNWTFLGIPYINYALYYSGRNNRKEYKAGMNIWYSQNYHGSKSSKCG